MAMLLGKGASAAIIGVAILFQPCAAKRLTFGSVHGHKELVDEKEDSSVQRCRYVKPENADPSESYPGMAHLTDPGWKVSGRQGEADGLHMLFYAYGPMFKGKGQVGAWKYNEKTGFIEYYYSKSHCQGMCEKCCGRGKGNTPGMMSAPLNPSAKVSWGKYKLEKRFKPGAEIATPFGKFHLRDLGGKFRLESAAHSGCYLDHIFACSKDDTVLKGKDANGNICEM